MSHWKGRHLRAQLSTNETLPKYPGKRKIEWSTCTWPLTGHCTISTSEPPSPAPVESGSHEDLPQSDRFLGPKRGKLSRKRQIPGNSKALRDFCKKSHFVADILQVSTSEMLAKRKMKVPRGCPQRGGAPRLDPLSSLTIRDVTASVKSKFSCRVLPREVCCSDCRQLWRTV